MTQKRHRIERRRINQRFARIALLSVCSILSACSIGIPRVIHAAPAPQPPPASSTAGPTIVATVGSDRITRAAVIAGDRAAFDTQRSTYERQLHALQFNYAQVRHQLLKQQLDDFLDRQALDKEAKARGKSPQALLGGIEVPAVTDSEVRAFYDQNKSRTRFTYEQLAPRIRQYLAAQHNDAAVRAFYRRLRAKYGIVSDLQPFRVVVPPSGPSRGRAGAPVTIVEFADFQCPYCKEAESTLHTLLAQYPTQVRLVFRNLPIPDLHPHALIAAKAGVCARRQGKFWPMHDLMYADQNALDLHGLEGMAKRAGLDAPKFAACLSDASTLKPISADLEVADRLGLTSTPYFFVDGRPVNGSVPLEQFESLVSDELQRLKRSHALDVSRVERFRQALD